ncbi:hypothetical protein E2C01_001044 [Portunus trituberculatus]|uniref:Uncharacterized protein n=1 Tax=Portunus trituberculatus TaxID=210409 RepID=A0A5B7CG77_PORTR|nr:hypothetical protein [Portunus trituberculatus]
MAAILSSTATVPNVFAFHGLNACWGVSSGSRQQLRLRCGCEGGASVTSSGTRPRPPLTPLGKHSYPNQGRNTLV